VTADAGRHSRRPEHAPPHGAPATPKTAPRPGPARSRGWWPRFLLWTLALSAPAWWLADDYHLALRAAASHALGVPLAPVAPGEIEVHATQVLAAYAGMCLASARSSWRRRLLAIALGLPLLFGLELATGLLAIRTDTLAGAGALPAWVIRVRDQFLVAPPWLGAPLLWLVLLGRPELRGLSGPASPRRR
jgi:hypothetical protein